MNLLDPCWLSIELDAVQKEQEHWDRALKSSYAIAVQRVFEHQVRLANAPNREEFAPFEASEHQLT